MSIVRAEHELEDYRARGFANRMGFGKKSALLVIDLTNGFTDPAMPLGSPSEEVIAQTNVLIDAAHAAGIPVYFSTISYDGPEMSDAGVWFRKMQNLETLKAGTFAVEIDSRLHRSPEDSILVKRYASCFFGTEFSSRLRSQGIDTLLIAGCSTSGCVRATAVDACQNGLRTIVVRGAVADRSKAAHDQSLVDIEAKYGDVVTLADALAYLSKTGKALSAINGSAVGAIAAVPSGGTLDGAAEAIRVQVRDVMRKQTSSLAILTAQHGEERTGIVVSSVISVSLDPASVLISVNGSSSLFSVLKKSGRFSVNWLGTSHIPLVPVFSGQLKGDARFGHGGWRDLDGMPALTDARAIFVCSVDAEFSYGSHTLFIGRVDSVSKPAPSPALLWYDGVAIATPFLTSD